MNGGTKPGIWRTCDPVFRRLEKPTVFLDRDGVIVQDMHYLADPDNVHLLVGSAGALRNLHENGWRLICLTNQSGIGRGRYGFDDFAAVQTRVDELLAAQGVVLDALYYCPHDPATGCSCRKPATGMLEAARLSAAWRAEDCWMIGDKVADTRLGEAAGLSTILVRTGHGRDVADDILPPGTMLAADLAAAAAMILAGERR